MKADVLEMLGTLDGWAGMELGNTQTEVENKLVEIMLTLMNRKEERGKKEVSMQ